MSVCRDTSKKIIRNGQGTGKQIRVGGAPPASKGGTYTESRSGRVIRVGGTPPSAKGGTYSDHHNGRSIKAGTKHF